MTWKPSLEVATRCLRTAAQARQHSKVLTLHDGFFATGHPRQLLEEASEEDRIAFRAWFEAWDDVLMRWWLAPKRVDVRLLKQFCLPGKDGFAFRVLMMNAWWLRESESDRVCTGDPLPPLETLHTLPLQEQCRYLARFCLRNDGALPFDYAAVADALHPRLRPFLTQWFLCVYLMSPWSNLDEGVTKNRTVAAARFADFYEAGDEVPLPLDPLLTVSGYRATYFHDQPRRFVSALSEKILGPSLAALGVGVGSEEATPSSGVGWRTGAYLSCFSDGSSVQRGLDPMLDILRERGMAAFVPTTDDGGQLRELPAHWKTEGAATSTVPGPNDARGVAEAAARIREAQLDFLFYPEIGLSAGSRWLSSLRLARVQAAGYGHPVTTGSGVIDYFVGSQAIEGESKTYRERLVLLPGLSISITAPLVPSRPRQRPSSNDTTWLISAANFDKYNPRLLQLWSAILDRLGPRTRLFLLTCVPQTHLPRFAERMRPYLKLDRVELIPQVPRQSCVDLLQEADVYLDSFPYAGGNSVVEALACGCPVVTLEGRHAYERSGAAILREIGLPDDFVARTPAEYADAVARLSADPGLRDGIRSGLSAEGVLEQLSRADTADHFAAAVDWMCSEGPAKPGPPVLIAAGDAPRFLST